MTKWIVDASHTNVGFSVKHMMVSKVRGRFTGIEGTIEGNPEDLTGANIDFTLDVATIHTNSEDRDNHLRSGDFFDVEAYPNLSFVSTEIVKTGDNEYDLTGDLTIKDVTKKDTFKVVYEGTEKIHGAWMLLRLKLKVKFPEKNSALHGTKHLKLAAFLSATTLQLQLKHRQILLKKKTSKRTVA